MSAHASTVAEVGERGAVRGEKPGEPSLSSHAARGVAWVVAQTLVLKVVTALGQIALAHFLVPDDFGLVTLAATFTLFAGFIQQGGLRQVLVQRQARFGTWANAGFWLSLVTGVVAAGLVLAAAPIAAVMYNEPRVVGVMAVAAVTMVVGAAAIVPRALLQTRLRFRTLAMIDGANAMAYVALAITLAWQGFGAYSIVGATAIVSIISTTSHWALAPVALRARPQARRWKYLLSESVYLLFGTMCVALTSFGAYIVLGMRYTTDQVGLFYFAYHLSLQTIFLVSYQAEGVLFASLSKLKDEAVRQTEAYLRAVRVLGLIAIPTAFLQAAAAEPLVRLLFPERWYPAIPLLQILSLGMAFATMVGPAYSLLMAQSRFRAYFLLALGNLAVYLLLVVGASRVGEPELVAGAVAVFFTLASFTALRTATWRGDVSSGRILANLLPAAGIGAAGVGTAYGLASLLPATPEGMIAQVAVLGVVSGVLVPRIARVVWPRAWDEFAGQVTAVLPRKLHGAFAMAACWPLPLRAGGRGGAG